MTEKVFKIAELIVTMLFSVFAACSVGFMTHAADAGYGAYDVYDDVPLTAAEQQILQQVCDEENVSYEFALAILQSESNFKSDAVGDSGRSVGYFQINRVNWKRMKDDYGLDVHKPEDNLQAGVHIIAEIYKYLQRRYSPEFDDPYAVIICYKAGNSKGLKLYEKGVYRCKSYDCYEICEAATAWEESHGQKVENIGK